MLKELPIPFLLLSHTRPWPADISRSSKPTALSFLPIFCSLAGAQSQLMVSRPSVMKPLIVKCSPVMGVEESVSVGGLPLITVVLRGKSAHR